MLNCDRAQTTMSTYHMAYPFHMIVPCVDAHLHTNTYIRHQFHPCQMCLFLSWSHLHTIETNPHSFSRDNMFPLPLFAHFDTIEPIDRRVFLLEIYQVINSLLTRQTPPQFQYMVCFYQS